MISVNAEAAACSCVYPILCIEQKILACGNFLRTETEQY